MRARSLVRRVLDAARDLGFLGPGPIDPHLVHARGFMQAAPPPDDALDLGSGGGLPGLVLAELWPTSRWVLLDSSQRRTDFLRQAVDELGWSERVRVVRDRAEVFGRDPAVRHRLDLVVARSFGPPAVTAECGAPFLRVGGRLVTSEPPATGSRWPVGGLRGLGLALGPTLREGAGYQVLIQEELCPERFPRREGVPARRPLF